MDSLFVVKMYIHVPESTTEKIQQWKVHAAALVRQLVALSLSLTQDSTVHIQ